jgi:drug/metabolite transporter superfamily protein YnfA
MTAKVAIFALAAFFEIAGCFSFWMWLRRGATIPGRTPRWL